MRRRRSPSRARRSTKPAEVSPTGITVQEMLDFCAEMGIVSDMELIPIQRISQAYDRMVKSDVRYRFVIDLATL
jgi:D-arabinose 1-dehydrogenase-like Zn-dependent alcohol dehydrogenase